MPNRRQEAEKCSSSFGNLQRTQWADAAVVVSGRRMRGWGERWLPFRSGEGDARGGEGARGGAQTFSPPFFWSEAAAAKLSAEIKLSHAKLNKKFIPPLGAMSDSLFGVPSLPPCMDDRTRRRPRIFKPRMAQRTRAADRALSLESRAGQTGCQKTFPPPPATATQCSLLYVAEGHKLFSPNYRPPAVFPPRRPPLDSAATEQPPSCSLSPSPP